MIYMTKEFIEQSTIRLDEYTSKIEKCISDLEEQEVWIRPNESSNSIGNLILHLCGNITQYILSSLNNKKDERQRDDEFMARDGYTKDELLKKLHNVVSQAKRVLQNIEDPDLIKVRSVQGFELSGLTIILHVVEHYSYHTGQIAFWTKLLRNKDLGFYDNFDLNQKNIPD